VSSFILTIGLTIVAIHCHGNNTFKVFDSHARDLCGNSFSQGTCVLLELSSLNYLVHHFQSMHYNALFELKEVQIKMMILFKLITYKLKTVLINTQLSIRVIL